MSGQDLINLLNLTRQQYLSCERGKSMLIFIRIFLLLFKFQLRKSKSDLSSFNYCIMERIFDERNKWKGSQQNKKVDLMT